MKTLLTLAIVVFFLNSSYAQEKFLKISNLKKEILIKEGKRVRVKTVQGGKISGKLQIVDDNTILVKNIKISIGDILKIKRNPLALTILSTGLFVFSSLYTLGIAILIEAFVGNGGILLTIPAAAFFYISTKPPNLLKGYKNTDGWNIKVIEQNP